MSQMSSICSVESEKVSMLFHRLILVAERDNTVGECFQYELIHTISNVSFQGHVMRKPIKADLYRNFAYDLTDTNLRHLLSMLPIVDIHKARWNPKTDLCNSLPLFLTFVSRLGRGMQVEFYAYASGPNISDHELGCTSWT